jgi:hypothetical protein
VCGFASQASGTSGSRAPPGYVEKIAPPSIRSSTLVAPSVFQWSWTCVGALHVTGDGGPVSERIFTVDEGGGVVGGAVVPVVDGVVEVEVEVGLVARVVLGVDLVLLEHAVSTTNPTITASGASRTLGIGRS